LRVYATDRLSQNAAALAIDLIFICYTAGPSERNCSSKENSDKFEIEI
jgi:hypothetical protein